MATAAFRSTAKRSSIGVGGGAATEDAGSSNRAGSHRRSRSLSRYPGRFPPPPPESEEFATPRARFVNKTRGSGFPEISLDDLADELFRAREETEEESGPAESDRSARSGRRSDEARFRMETDSSRRRGRSVSRASVGGNGVNGSDGGGPRARRSVSVARNRNTNLEDENDIYHDGPRNHDRWAKQGKDRYGNDHSLRRRSLSVARHQFGDLEDHMDKTHGSSKLSFNKGNIHQSSSQKETNTIRVLRRSMSQKDLLQSDTYSSHSSSLTDDEARDVHYNKSGSEKTIQAVYALEKADHPIGDGDGSGLYEVMRKEVRHAVEEIRTELEKAMVKMEPKALLNAAVNQPRNSNGISVIAEIRRNYTTKLEQSEKRKHDLLAELAAEEQHGQELTSIVRELLPAPTQTAIPERPSRSRRRSNDRTRTSKCLTEEAEKYFEDFLSNVEDTDISSFDGERSDASSTVGGSTKLREPSMHNAISESLEVLAKAAALPAQTDGLVLPWLEWETDTDASPLPSSCKERVPMVVETEAKETSPACKNNGNPRSSFGSWNPEGNDSPSAASSGVKGSRFEEVGSHSFSAIRGKKGSSSSFDMDEYLQLQRSEDLLFEMFKQRHRIESGSLILCGRTQI